MAIYQAVAKQRWLGQEIRNVFYYTTENSDVSAVQYQQVANLIRTAWATPLTTYMKTSWRLYGVDFRRVDVAGWPTLEFGFGSGDLVGTQAGQDLPTQIAMVVNGTAVTVKPNRVRSFLGGFTETHLVDGLFPAAALTQALNWADNMDTHADTDLPSWGRVSAEWNAAHTAVVAFNRIEAYTATNIPGTQRRRRIGRGI